MAQYPPLTITPKSSIMTRLILLLALLLPQTTALADDASHRAAAEKLMHVMIAKTMLDSMYAQVDRIFLSMAKQAGITAEHQPLLKTYLEKLNSMLKAEMGWEKIQKPMVDIYIKHYTEQEINGLRKFYESPLGRKLLAKMPQVLQESMRVSQNMMGGFIPKIKAMIKQMDADIKAVNKPANK